MCLHARRPDVAATRALVHSTHRRNVCNSSLRAALIHKQAVELKVMPPGNMTQMTDAERAAIGRWFAARK